MQIDPETEIPLLNGGRIVVRPCEDGGCMVIEHYIDAPREQRNELDCLIDELAPMPTTNEPAYDIHIPAEALAQVIHALTLGATAIKEDGDAE